MQMSSISILAAGTAVIAPLAVFLRYLLKQPFKVASTSQELFDLFEGALLEEHATPTSPNDDSRASEHFTAAPSNDLAPASASSTELWTSAEAYLVYRVQPARGLYKNNNGRARSSGTFASAEEEINAVSLRNLHGL
jgi:hypothetical protein